MNLLKKNKIYWQSNKIEKLIGIPTQKNYCIVVFRMMIYFIKFSNRGTNASSEICSWMQNNLESLIKKYENNKKVDIVKLEQESKDKIRALGYYLDKCI